jgi:ribonuclease HII
MLTPTFKEERALLVAGYAIVAGVDEVGCGCLAGPVFAAAAILPIDSGIGLIRDSKTLSASQRERLAERLRTECAAWAVAQASAEEVDRLNIRGAGALAMRRAIESLSMTPQLVLIDAFRIPGLAMPSKSIIRGDLKVKSIAAASVIAKVSRDAHMDALDLLHPGYGFAAHKGYATAEHRAALRRLGPSPEHRRTYAPVIASLLARRAS